MVRHNNRLPNAHFHKDWARRVRTWFDQPAQKNRRRMKRTEKAAKIFPRPTAGALRPVVRGQTVKYNLKERFGRGFTLEEIKAAGISQRYAPTVGVAVDHRRKNRSVEGLQKNVDRLKDYLGRLVLLPLRRASKKLFANEVSADQFKARAQQFRGTLLPIQRNAQVLQGEAAISESSGSAYEKMRMLRGERRAVGKVAAARKKAE